MGEIRSDRIARYLELIEKPDEALDVIVQRMTGGELGYEGLPAICRALDIPYGKVIGWLMADAERYAVYNRALEVQAKALVSEAIEIADVGEDVARDKLRVDTRFRLAKYHDSRVYGDKVTGGGDSGITVIVNRDVSGGGGGVEIQAKVGGQKQTLVVTDAEDATENEYL